uniref:Uncharacterized protein n=1 Tax=Rhizophora mucronata TaxID=61149 RepID=A0A2P2LX22_RHIMU
MEFQSSRERGMREGERGRGKEKTGSHKDFIFN